MKVEHNYVISFCRILGMIMIVVCHIGTAMDNATIGQTFQVGVQLFLLISGYLYGRKDIDDSGVWLRKRYKKLCIPCYIFIITMIVINLIMKNIIDYRSVVIEALNLQGYYHIFTFMPQITPIVGTAHLWFITVIFLCYFFTILVKKGEIKLQEKNFVKLLFVSFFISVILGIFGIRIDYFIIYFIGYFISKLEIKQKKGVWIATICMLCGIVLRISMKAYCDVNGDNNLYLYVVIPWSYNLIACAIWGYISCFEKIIKKLCQSKKVAKVVDFFDGLSLFIYITHYQFIDAPLSMVHFTESIFVNVLVSIILILITAILLKQITLKVCES